MSEVILSSITVGCNVVIS